jgi:hypothetical protein
MVDVIVDQLQKRSAMQAEKADDFEQGKTTAGLLTATLRRRWYQPKVSLGRESALATKR